MGTFFNCPISPSLNLPCLFLGNLFPFHHRMADRRRGHPEAPGKGPATDIPYLRGRRLSIEIFEGRDRQTDSGTYSKVYRKDIVESADRSLLERYSPSYSCLLVPARLLASLLSLPHILSEASCEGSSGGGRWRSRIARMKDHGSGTFFMHSCPRISARILDTIPYLMILFVRMLAGAGASA